MRPSLRPESWAERVRRSAKSDFLSEYGETPLLLVKLSHRYEQVATFLEAYTTANGQALPASGSYDTSVHLVEVLPEAADRPIFDAHILSGMLRRSSYFAAPIRKRAGASKPFEDRVSVGRARNNDIVLRDESVSKFHAWFEKNDNMVLYVADAGSTNATLLNGRPLSRTPETARSGDEIRFGNISTTLCQPETFWEALVRR
jgi:hypothetical protein